MSTQAHHASESHEAREPIRTCVGCRRREPASALLRIAYDRGSSALVPDPRRRMPGRGAWVHREERCVTTALDRRGLQRTLRVDGTVSTDAVTQVLDAIRAERAHEGEKNGPDTMSTP